MSPHDSDPNLPESELYRLYYFIITNHVPILDYRCVWSAFEHNTKSSSITREYYRLLQIASAKGTPFELYIRDRVIINSRAKFLKGVRDS